MEYENTEERAAESGLNNNPAGGGQNGGAADKTAARRTGNRKSVSTVRFMRKSLWRNGA